MAKPLRTRTRSGRLASVFSTVTSRHLHSVIASLSVLFEDLRIELNGMSAEDLGRLDECGKTYRELYFTRRSIATLHEFSQLLHELNAIPEFERIRSTFDPTVERAWSRAVRYFGKYDRYVKRLRNNVGGHFGRAAGEEAIKHLLPDASGCLEVRFFQTGGGAKLGFATELAATGTLCHVPGSSIPAKARRLYRHALVGYRMAVRAVDCIMVMYLWDRFGR